MKKDILETDELIERLMLELDSLLEEFDDSIDDKDDTSNVRSLLDQLQVAGFKRYPSYDSQTQLEKDEIKQLLNKVPRNQYK